MSLTCLPGVLDKPFYGVHLLPALQQILAVPLIHRRVINRFSSWVSIFMCDNRSSTVSSLRHLNTHNSKMVEMLFARDVRQVGAGPPRLPSHGSGRPRTPNCIQNLRLVQAQLTSHLHSPGSRSSRSQPTYCLEEGGGGGRKAPTDPAPTCSVSTNIFLLCNRL